MGVLFEAKTEGSIQDRVETKLWEEPGGLWQMEIPVGFMPMDEERKKQYFPYVHSPEAVMYYEEEEVFLTSQLLSKERIGGEVLNTAQQIQELVKDTWPQHKVTPVCLWEEEQHTAAWFAMTMEEGKQEHIKLVFGLSARPGRMVLMTFTYPEEKRHKWPPILHCLFSTVQEKEQEGGAYDWDRKG